MRLPAARSSTSTRASAAASCRRSTAWRASGAGRPGDWFFFVNGVEADVGAAEYELSPGDRVQWDHRDWAGRDARAGDRRRLPRAVPARARGQAPPGARGVRGRGGRRPAEEARDRARGVGVPTSGASLGAPGTRDRHPPGGGSLAARPDRARRAQRSRRARRRAACSRASTADGRSLELLDESGDVARTVRPGDGIGLVARDAPARRGAGVARDRARRGGARGGRARARRGRACGTPSPWP